MGGYEVMLPRSVIFNLLVEDLKEHGAMPAVILSYHLKRNKKIDLSAREVSSIIRRENDGSVLIRKPNKTEHHFGNADSCRDTLFFEAKE